MDLTDVLKEIEEEERLKDRVNASKIFKSMLNQPSLVSINSINATQTGSQNEFSSFTANFDRSILSVDTLQLLSTSIPQCNPSIPNTALVFWYYRLSALTGTTPCLNNLYCVRLLPSFYNPEFIQTPTSYGFNKTFLSYTALATELAKATTRDVGYENLLIEQKASNSLSHQWSFIPNDIRLTYNSAFNKFQMTGNSPSFAYIPWEGDLTYFVGQVVVYNGKAYVATADNVNQQPGITPEFWNPSAAEIIPQWKAGTYYTYDNLVTFQKNIYMCLNIQLVGGASPALDNTDWLQAQGNSFKRYRYLIAGYQDPNVKIKQGPLFDMPWETSHYYSTGDKVTFKGRYFQALDETSLFVPGNVKRYDPYLVYAPFDVVYKDDEFHMFTSPTQSTILKVNPNADSWTGYKLYNYGDLVMYEGRQFKYIYVNSTEEFFAESPPTDPTYWELQAKHPLNALTFNNSYIYTPGTFALFNGNIYVSIVANQNTELEYWNFVGHVVWKDYNYELIMQQPGSIVYFNGKYSKFIDQTPRVTGQPQPAWDEQTSYPSYYFVNYLGNYYISLKPSVNQEPSGDTEYWRYLVEYYWDPYTESLGTQTGLAGLSAEHDFIIGTLANIPETVVDTQPFPENIGGQPFSRNPKRLLNSILGFTWNGLFNPVSVPSLQYLSSAEYINRKQIPLYNRIRPVPQYDGYVDETLQLSDILVPPALTTFTYTAEGYANLVYSSIVHIYTNVIGGSTLDTLRNTNLLATTSMNCGNLGVSFYNSYIDTPLVRVIGGDIDSMYIELQDEMGDPFYLTNNAVMTLTFKVTYREKAVE